MDKGQSALEKDNPQYHAQDVNSGITTTGYYWEALNLPEGVTIQSFQDLAVHPQDSKIIYLATQTAIYRSDNAGETWGKIDPGSFSIHQIEIAANNPQRIYLTDFFLNRSDDGGVSWDSFNSPLSICFLTVAPSDEDILYAQDCSDSSTIHRSSNGGQTWTIPNAGFSPRLNTFKMVVHPKDPNLVIGTTPFDIFRSSNGGTTWVNVDLLYECCIYQSIFSNDIYHTIYVAHSSGLLRSIDDGVSFEYSGSDVAFRTITNSLTNPDEILGGNSTSSWKVVSKDHNWSAAGWNAPPDLIDLWRSDRDQLVLYARTSSELWRYIKSTKNWPAGVFIPFLVRDEHVDGSSGAQQALDRVNLYRNQAGVVPLRSHSAIVDAAQNHANYHMLNFNDQSAWIYGPHREVEGKPGFTGRTAGDRMVAAGYPWDGYWEIMHYIGDPIKSVDGWMSTVYHRFPIIDPYLHYTGYGFGKNSRTKVDVMDFGYGPIDSGYWYSDQLLPLAYPVDGQVGVPTNWNGLEIPDPLPSGASRPVGYPFTLQVDYQDLIVDTIVMRDQSGQEVNVHPNPSGCLGFYCYALIPVKPLKENTTYTVHATGFVDDFPFDRTWSFTTGGRMTTLLESTSDSLIGPPDRLASSNIWGKQ